MDLSGYSDENLINKREELKRYIKIIDTELQNRNKLKVSKKSCKSFTITTPTTTKSIKASKKTIMLILKNSKIPFSSSSTKQELEELIRKNNLVTKTELTEAKIKLKAI